MFDKIAKRIALLTNLAVLVLAVVLLAQAAFVIKRSTERRSSSSTMSATAVKALPDNAAFKTAPKTLVIFLSSSCPYCQKSAGELAYLSTLSEGRHLPFVAVFRPFDHGADSFFNHEKFEGRILKLSAQEFPSLPTPSILLVDPGGIVLQTWKGQLTRERAEMISFSIRGRG